MSHESLRALVLSQEDLTDEEAEIVEAHLALCPDCRELLANLECIEARAGELGTLPSATDDTLYQLSPSEERAERESLKALMDRLDTEIGVGGKR